MQRTVRQDTPCRPGIDAREKGALARLAIVEILCIAIRDFVISFSSLITQRELRWTYFLFG